MNEQVDKIMAKIKPFLDWVRENIDEILAGVVAIGAAFLAWKIAKGVQDFLRWLSTMKGFNIVGSIGFKIAGLGLFLDAWNTMKEAIQDIMANGANFTNVTKLISGFAEALGAAFLLFGNIKMAGAMLVISGLTGIVSAISDMVSNGVNWDNALFLVKNLGLFLSGLGLLTGNTQLGGVGLIIAGAIVPCYSYQNGTQEDNLVGEEVEVTAGDVQTFFIGEPSYGFRAALEDTEGGVTIEDWGNYYITVRFSVTGKYRLEIYGYRYKIVERYAVKALNNRGKTIKWENPMMSDMGMANDLAEWLGDYYASGIEYEYDTRGNPEIDVNDIVYQENEFHSNMKVNIYRHTVNFNQSFSGKVTARRVGGAKYGLANP